MTSQTWKIPKNFWRKRLSCQCGCQIFLKASGDRGRCWFTQNSILTVFICLIVWLSRSCSGGAHGGASRHREDSLGQSCCYRMQNHIFQRVFLHAHLQVQRRVWKTCSSSVWNGEICWYVCDHFALTDRLVASARPKRGLCFLFTLIPVSWGHYLTTAPAQFYKTWLPCKHHHYGV